MDQGTSPNSIDIVSDAGGISLTGTSVNCTGHLNVEPSGSLDGSASNYHLIFGGDGSEGSWRVTVGNSNKLHFERHNGATWVIKAKIG